MSALLAACTTTQPTPQPVPDDTTGLLQAVAMNLTGDATLTSVEATNVFTTKDSRDSQAFTTSYSPAEVVSDIPVRVVTAYQAGEKHGTHLADLAGYTGRVEITVTVENLTQRSTTLTFDVAGESHQQTALIAVPLTVVASAHLPNTAASQVIAASPTSSGTVTNGVISPSGKDTSVQWATILAPPQLAASTVFTLVIDANDFRVPDFNITVQPGMLTTISAVDAAMSAFGENITDDVELLSRTIELIGDVNTVLGRASDTLTQMATHLDSTAETLGHQTVDDLKLSTAALAQSMQTLDKEARGLGDTLSSSLTTTQSVIISQISQLAHTVGTFLGDTSTPPATATVSGDGCAMIVSAPEQATDVYGSLMQIVGQLDAYSIANQNCKTVIQQSLTDMVGPLSPTVADCADSSSLACTLLDTKDGFNSIIADFRTAGQNAVAALRPQQLADTRNQYNSLSTHIDSLFPLIAAARDLQPTADLTALDAALADAETRFSVVENLVSQLTARIDELASKLATIKTTANTAHDEVSDPDQPNKGMLDQLDALRGQICVMNADGVLSDSQAALLVSYISSSSCVPNPSPEPTPAPGPTATEYPVPLSDRLTSQAEALDQIVAEATLTGEPVDAATAISDMETVLDGLRQSYVTLVTANNADGSARQAAWDALSSQAATLVVVRDTLGATISSLTSYYDDLASQMGEDFSTITDTAIAQVDAFSSATLAQMNTGLVTGLGSVNEVFAQSSLGFARAAEAITVNGAAIVDGQELAIAAITAQTGVTISNQVQSDLERINASVSASSTNLNAAATLLADDLERVLLDLGDQANGTGLLGVLGASAATADSAKYQMAVAAQTAASYANVRSQDIAGIHLRQSQTQAALEALTAMPAFRVNTPPGATHRTVYTIHLSGATR